jgi:hypothetical protein
MMPEKHEGTFSPGYDYDSKEEGIWMTCTCGFRCFSRDECDVDEVLRRWNKHKET